MTNYIESKNARERDESDTRNTLARRLPPSPFDPPLSGERGGDGAQGLLRGPRRRAQYIVILTSPVAVAVAPYFFLFEYSLRFQHCLHNVIDD